MDVNRCCEGFYTYLFPTFPQVQSNEHNRTKYCYVHVVLQLKNRSGNQFTIYLIRSEENIRANYLRFNKSFLKLKRYKRAMQQCSILLLSPDK